MATSWNVGMAGVIGLRWEVLPVFLSVHQVPQDMWRDTLGALRVMEAEALRVLRRQH